MSFVDGFYSFFVNLSDTSNGIYEDLKLKTAKHPNESAEHLISRTLAYLHSYSPELKFTEGLYNEKDPAIMAADVIGTINQWVEIGAPEKKKLAQALKHHDQARFRIYFYEEEQIEKFCHYLRGSKSNWVANIEFFLLDLTLLSHLAENLQLRSNWSISFFDDSFYLTIEDMIHESTIIGVDIWDRFQNSIELEG